METQKRIQKRQQSIIIDLGATLHYMSEDLNLPRTGPSQIKVYLPDDSTLQATNTTQLPFWQVSTKAKDANRTCDIICRFVPGDPGRNNWPPEPFLCQPWLLTGKIPDHQKKKSKYPDMGFPSPWGKKPFSRQIIGAALSCHRFTQCTKLPITAKTMCCTWG